MTSRKEEQDGGYGWINVFSSHLIHVIQYGLSWTVGIFYVIFLEEIGGSKKSVALVSSLNTATFYVAGRKFLFKFCSTFE